MDQIAGVAVLPILMVAFFYFFLIRPNNKQKKEQEVMRSNLSVGDNVTTIGGILGRIVNIKEGGRYFVIESSVDRTKILVERWAVSENKGVQKEPDNVEKKSETRKEAK
ncbi:MAG: preprotein translocase subunit YajC [Oscillospiraceae bacterium]|jgi:preprotein translocase subunit YajC|nr:preprotein translocase subunit YajC [Oscillospiraceae bacterium]